jgi:hypothetical protein
MPWKKTWLECLAIFAQDAGCPSDSRAEVMNYNTSKLTVYTNLLLSINQAISGQV